MPETMQNTTPAKPKRWMRWLLVASLALNFLVIGAVAGTFLSGGHKRSGPASARSISAPYIQAFDREDKQAMRSEMRAQLPKHREMFRKTKEEFTQFINLLRADEFDLTAAQSIMDAQMQRTSDTMQLGRRITLDRIGAMSADERIAYADRLEERVENMGRRKPGKGARADREGDK